MTTTPSNVEFPISATPLADDWAPYEIVYTRYTRNKAGDIVTHPGSYVVCKKTIEQFIKELLNGEQMAPACYTRKRHADDKEPGTPQDIYVGCASYVVIELDPRLDWHFENGRPGVTTKEDYGTSNRDLRHVMANGTVLGSDGPEGNDCRIVYFAVTERDKVQRQHFHLHVVSEKQHKDPVQIDPDIPNDGGKFPTFPRSPCIGTQEGAPHCT